MVTDKAESWRVYRDELERQGEALLLQLASVANRAEEVCARLELDERTQLCLVGSGDSYCAAVSCQYLYGNVLGLAARPVEAFDLSLYHVPLLGPQTLVLTTSISGRTRSALAALEAASRHGAQALLITNTPGSPATELAAHTIHLDLPSIDTSGLIPSTLSYLGGCSPSTALGSRWLGVWAR